MRNVSALFLLWLISMIYFHNDSMGQSQYSVMLGLESYSFYLDTRQRMITMDDGGFVTYHFENGGHALTRLDSTGHIVWKHYGENILSLFPLTNGKFASASAYSYDTTGGINRFGVILNMHQPNGQFQWQKRLDTAIAHTVHIQQASNGDLVVLVGRPNTNEFGLIRVDTLGNIIWSRKGQLDNNQVFLKTNFNDFDISPSDGMMAAIIKPPIIGTPFNRAGILFWDSLGNPLRGYYSEYNPSVYELWNNAEFDANNNLILFGVDHNSPFYMGGSNNSYNYLLIDSYQGGFLAGTQVFDMAFTGYFEDIAVGTVLENGDRVINFRVNYILGGNPIPDDNFLVVIGANNILKAAHSLATLQGDTLQYSMAAPLTMHALSDSSIAFVDNVLPVGQGQHIIMLSVMNPYSPSCYLPSYYPLISMYPIRTNTQFLFTQGPVVPNQGPFTSTLIPAPVIIDSLFCDDQCNPLPLNYTVVDSGLSVNFSYPYPILPTHQIQWSFGDGATSNQANGTHTYATPGNYTICLKRSNAGCQPDSVCMSILIQPCPVAAIQPISPICAGDSLVAQALASGTNANYSWWLNNSPYGLGLTNTIPINPQIPNWLVLKVSRGLCVDSVGQWVPVSPVPQPGLPPSLSFCQGGSITLNANPGYAGYAWSTGQSTQTITVSNPGWVMVTVSNTDGCTGLDSIEILQWNNPQVNLGPDIEVCQGNTVQLTGPSGMQSYAWSNGPVSQTQTIANPGTYGLTVTDANGCAGTDMVNITVDSLPVVNLGSGGQFCAGDTVTISSGLIGTYMWSTGSTNAQISITAPGMYSLTFTDGNGCQGTDTVQWNLAPSPNPNLGMDTLLCQGDTMTLAAPLGMASYLWSDGTGLSSLSVPDPGTYSLTITDGNGCQGIDTITISPGPAAPIGQFSATQNGNTFSFVSNTLGIVQTYFWDFGDGTSSSSPNPIHTFSTAGTYNVCLMVSNQCGADTFCQPQLLVSRSAAQPMPGIRIYPNPTDGQFYLELDFDQSEATEINIVNGIGQQLVNRHLGQISADRLLLDASLWPTGIYEVVIRRGEHLWTNKLKIN